MLGSYLQNILSEHKRLLLCQCPTSNIAEAWSQTRGKVDKVDTIYFLYKPSTTGYGAPLTPHSIGRSLWLGEPFLDLSFKFYKVYYCKTRLQILSLIVLLSVQFFYSFTF